MNPAKATAAAPKVPSALAVQLRGPLALLVAVALILGLPSLAYATFTSRATASVSVGTYKIPAPASINGTLQCVPNGQGADHQVHRVRESRPCDGLYGDTEGSAGGVATMPAAPGTTVQVSVSGSPGTYTFSLVARVGSWHGHAAGAIRHLLSVLLGRGDREEGPRVLQQRRVIERRAVHDLVDLEVAGELAVNGDRTAQDLADGEGACRRRPGWRPRSCREGW